MSCVAIVRKSGLTRFVFCPRMRGEKRTYTSHSPVSPGLPPYARGKAAGRKRFTIVCGITPACAGKSHYSAPSVSHGRDHPRACGEKALSAFPLTNTRGSPPRVRGKALPQSQRQRHNGITPACAGKRSARAAIFPCSRITPACAGKRSRTPDAFSSRWNHPRVCGEKICISRHKRAFAGSPPRVRGKGAGARRGRPARGITPACAGKSKTHV